MEEIEAAFIALKCGCSKGADGLNSEHIIYGGDSLKLWLNRFSMLLFLLKKSCPSKKALSFLFIREKERIPC